jgi:hypothetical protein
MHYQHNSGDRVLVRAGYGARSGRVVEQLGKFGPYGEPLYSVKPDGEEWTPETAFLCPQSMLGTISDYEAEHSETVPALYVGESAESLTTELADLLKLANVEEAELDEWSNDELLGLDIGYGVAGPLSAAQVREEAEDRLNALPLCVEASTTFEIVLGTGGPDRRLLIECSGGGVELGSEDTAASLEIRRVLFRYSWSSSAEVELTGEAKEAAEEFARRVVPELIE